jgi:hypothetical protein
MGHRDRLKFKNSVPTFKKTRRITIMKFILLMMFRKSFAAASQNPMKPMKELCGRHSELSNFESRWYT